MLSWIFHNNPYIFYDKNVPRYAPGPAAVQWPDGMGKRNIIIHIFFSSQPIPDQRPLPGIGVAQSSWPPPESRNKRAPMSNKGEIYTGSSGETSGPYKCSYMSLSSSRALETFLGRGPSPSPWPPGAERWYHHTTLGKYFYIFNAYTCFSAPRELSVPFSYHTYIYAKLSVRPGTRNRWGCLCLQSKVSSSTAATGATTQSLERETFGSYLGQLWQRG